MPTFSKSSLEKLSTCKPELAMVFNEVVKWWDCAIVSGRRGEEEQNSLFDRGFSQVRYPHSKHNTSPLSSAVDVAPWSPIPPHIKWDDQQEFYAFGKYVLIVAQQLGVNLRWGMDWDMDGDWRDENFLDAGHFELVDEYGI